MHTKAHLYALPLLMAAQLAQRSKHAHPTSTRQLARPFSKHKAFSAAALLTQGYKHGRTTSEMQLARLYC